MTDPAERTRGTWLSGAAVPSDERLSVQKGRKRRRILPRSAWEVLKLLTNEGRATLVILGGFGIRSSDCLQAAICRVEMEGFKIALTPGEDARLR